MYLKRKLQVLILLIATAAAAQAQDVAIKTNILSDALLNVNAGIEIGLAPKWTLDVPGQFNGWRLSHDRRWKHWAVQPGARYWFCDRFQGHFVGVHAHGGQFNVGGFDGKVKFLGTDLRKLGENYFQGWFAGAGVSYGYDWILGRHWNLEAEIGVGYSYTRFDKYNCHGCNKKVGEDLTHHYYGPTKAAINLVYLF